MATQSALTAAGCLFDFDPSTLTMIRIWAGSPNHIYAFARQGKPYILRLSSAAPGWADRTRAEMDFLDALARGGARVSLPLASANGALVEEIQAEEGPLVLCAFEKADGVPCERDNHDAWNERVWYSWGGAMGEMHRLTKDYVPKTDCRRSCFDGRDVLLPGIAKDPEIERMIRAHVARLMALPKTRDNYGLIHQDMHQHNFFVDGGVVRVFDFDDSLYGPFALDLGIALYHALLWGLPDEPSQRQPEAERIVRTFMAGYLAENAAGEDVRCEVPAFMRYRQMSNLAWCMDEGEDDGGELERMRRGVVIEGVEIEKDWFGATSTSHKFD